MAHIKKKKRLWALTKATFTLQVLMFNSDIFLPMSDFGCCYSQQHFHCDLYKL